MDHITDQIQICMKKNLTPMSWLVWIKPSSYELNLPELLKLIEFYFLEYHFLEFYFLNFSPWNLKS